MTETVFVAGGTGKTGRRVVERLRDRDIAVRVGSRRAEIPFEWSAPSTWMPALGGASLVYVAYAPDLAVPEAAAHVEEFARLAAASGVRKIVLLSGRGEPEAQDAEKAVLARMPSATVLRASWMNQNFTEGMLAGDVRAGAVVLPVGDVPEPFVDTGDIAEAAVEVLLSDGHEGRIYELTGPRLMTFADAVREMAVASGRPVELTTVPLDDFVAALTAAGEPDEVVGLIRYLFATLFDGRNASLGTGVREILGREATDFRVFATDAAAAGAWDTRG